MCVIAGEYFDYTTDKGAKMYRLCFCAHVYLIGWLIMFSPWAISMFLPEVVVFPSDFILLWKIMSESCSIFFPLLEKRPTLTQFNAPHFNSIVTLFFPLWKTLCITNTIWLAGAIVWKKVGPFCWVSGKAFKLSPHFLLPSYRNLLDVLFAGLDNGVSTLLPYSDFCCRVIR